MNILVTGGAGYIGSFMTKVLLDNGYAVFVVDSLERGHKNAIDKRADFRKLNIGNTHDLEQLFLGQHIDPIIHFAAYISVEESTKNPELYYQNNVLGSKALFATAVEHNIKMFIFSSTAAVYGNPTQVPIPEDHPKNPTSPYGKTKLQMEEILSSLTQGRDISFTVLRYFNASGASLDGSLGENHTPETHIIPNAIKAALRNESFSLFGTDYKTSDGTCVRDYIHVLDLCDAHLLALEKLKKQKGQCYYNIGTGIGYSNLEVLKEVKRITGTKIKMEEKNRRPGDPNVLIADPAKIIQELSFAPKYSDIETIVKSAYLWHRNQA